MTLKINKIKIETSLKTGRLGNKLWILLDDFKVIVNNDEITVPKGFVFDGNSAPRALWSLCSPMGGAYGEAGVVHDWLYSLDSNFFPYDCSRQDADLIHKKIAEYRGADKLRTLLVYNSLRLFGGSSYKKKLCLWKINDKTCYDYDKAIDAVRELAYFIYSFDDKFKVQIATNKKD